MKAIKPPARIGWIGMGKMGLPICKRLRDAGFQVRALCRNNGAVSEATANGFEIGRTIRETVAGAAVVASAIPDDKALRDIALADGGLRDCLSREQIFVETSTVSPEASAQIAEALLPIGCAYLRSPVSGSTVTAGQGALTALVSGPADAFGALAGFFAPFSKKAFLVGAGEEARYLKLSINAMLGATSALLRNCSIWLGRAEWTFKPSWMSLRKALSPRRLFSISVAQSRPATTKRRSALRKC